MIQKKMFCSLLLTIGILFISCESKNKKGSDLKNEVSSVKIKYAKGFDFEQIDGVKKFRAKFKLHEVNSISQTILVIDSHKSGLFTRNKQEDFDIIAVKDLVSEWPSSFLSAVDHTIHKLKLHN